jgi:hypothetical protein
MTAVSISVRAAMSMEIRSMGKSSSHLWRGLSGVVRRVVLSQQTREFVPVKPSPAFPQASEKLEFAACENRHVNSC